MTTKYCWYNVETGEFSNCWGEETHRICKDSIEKDLSEDSPYKLLKLECISDDTFEFTHGMKVK